MAISTKKRLKSHIDFSEIVFCSNPYFIEKYLYPTPCKLGPLIASHVKSMKDISDGLIGDLTDMLNGKYGALINVNKIPLSVKTKKIL